jgi:hypothetical protein
MDTIQSNVPAIEGGEKYAQIFVGTKSLITDIHGMKSPAQFPGVLTDEMWYTYKIDQWQSPRQD